MIIQDRRKGDTRRTLAMLVILTACGANLLAMVLEVEPARLGQILSSCQSMAAFALGFYFASQPKDALQNPLERRPDSSTTTATVTTTESTVTPPEKKE